MKICPVCNDSFADQLNFCDIDGARLTREGSAHDRNKWWSLIGAGLLVGALVISAASIFFLPRARVSTPVVSSEPQASPTAAKEPPVEGAASAAAAVSAQPDSASSDVLVPEVRKKDRALTNGNFSGATPNPKAAATGAEDAERKAASADVNGAVPPVPKKSETSPSIKSVAETRSADAAAKPQTPPDLKKDQKAQTTTAKNSDKDSSDKKKNEDKDKKKGGFLRVFKKIFGKD